MRVQIARYFQLLRSDPLYPLSKSLPQMTGVLGPTPPKSASIEPREAGEKSQVKELSSEEKVRKHLEAVMVRGDGKHDLHLVACRLSLT